MKNKTTICLLIILIVIITAFISWNIFSINYISEPISSIIPISDKLDTTPAISRNGGNEIQSSLTQPEPAESQTMSYAYLFEVNREMNTSNIVGYFAHGAFAWYVPDWLVSNWEMKTFRTEGMIFSPKVRATPVSGQQYDFSDIEFDVSTSTEINNAENLYLTMLNNIPKDEIIINEVVLNKSTIDMISIQMENSTRIYHITAYTRDFKRISDLYFMDGNGKTLDLRFETKADIFPQFSNKIRDMVEGIGELKSPQG